MALVKAFLLSFLTINGLCIGTFFNIVSEAQLIDEILRNAISTNSNYDPDTYYSTPELIKRAGYPAEIHTVKTEDGYLLTVHRIPGNATSPPIFLHHGLLASSASWVITGKNKALAYILADEGYDVWLGNVRGNTYSRSHISLPSSDPRFWDFSWHEVGIYDLPAVISYITDYRQVESLLYIGHSMGTTVFYVMASELPEVASKVQAMFSLAPVAFMNHIESPIKILAPFSQDLELLSQLLGDGEFLSHSPLGQFFAKYFCDGTNAGKEICADGMFILCGFDKAEFNFSLTPVILNHAPAGASTKSLIHYTQETSSGNFCKYDYGSKKNMELYNSISPPNYNLSRINVPIALYYADNDWLADPVDVERLYKQLPNTLDYYKVQYEQFNHLDFLLAVDVREFLYDRLVTLINKQANLIRM